MENENKQNDSWWGEENKNNEKFTSGGNKDKKMVLDDGGTKKKKLAIEMSAGVLLILVVVFASVLTVMRPWEDNSNNTNNGDESAVVDDEEIEIDEEIVALDNTELTSGTVTTTIGGKSITYKGAYVVDGITATIGSGTYESLNDDEVVFLVINGGQLTVQGNVEINKTGSANFSGRGDNYSFYGTNSAIVVVGEGSSVTINGATITSSVSGANAVVATNSGEAVVKNTVIETTKDNSRGLHATYGGEITANNVAISTQGGSCAALATDRGAGTVKATNMRLSTAGAGSPLIYSTGAITVADSTGVATGAQIAVVEGKNSINLTNCEFSANGVGNRNNVDNAAVMIYQSMSGDASVGTGSFTAKDCTLKVLASSSVYDTTPFFFITNTDATINLDNVTAEFSGNEYFISALGTSEWGKSGSNGGKVTVSTNELTATNTKVEVDNISSVSGI